MKHEILLPALGDADTGEISDWYRATGDQVTVGEALVAVDIDKVTIDVPSVARGVLTIEAQLGTEVKVGDLLGWITEDD
jgi:pyruvate/2-oxoglutarate dehydrogenase complex dihydrolipoamide acyltransferase (E2) component